MRRIPIANARASLRDLVQSVQTAREPVKLTRYGKTQAWLVPVEHGELLHECKEELEDCHRRKQRRRR
jgi:PHD/YefM family antitoxin component YafN of YafNO toxin-antitoxin module